MRLFGKSVYLVLTVFLFSTCKKEPKTTIQPDPYPEQAWYPTKDGYTWIYQIYVRNMVNTPTTEYYTETGVFSQKEVGTIFYRDSQIFRYQYLTNTKNWMGCCGNIKYVDYSKLDCSGDSVLIYGLGDTSIEHYQYCKREFATAVHNYSDRPCIKTMKVRRTKDGQIGRTFTYYAKNIGMVYLYHVNYNAKGEVVWETTRKLISHKF